MGYDWKATTLVALAALLTIGSQTHVKRTSDDNANALARLKQHIDTRFDRAPASRAAETQTKKSASCKFETNDIGSIVGRGPTDADAFEDAATQCFERHRALYKAKRGVASDNDTAELYIDICVNLKCS